MTVPVMPRAQAVVIPILRAWPALKDVHIGSWIENIDYREFPMITILRRGGGAGRNQTFPHKMDMAVIELVSYSMDGMVECEHLYNHALDALYDAVLYQKQTDAGYLHSIMEPMGMTQFSSEYMDSWRTQGIIKLGLRPL